MSITIHLRAATLADLPAMQSLYVDVIDTACKYDYNEAQRTVWKGSIQKVGRWEEAITNQYFLLAESDGDLVGYGSLKDGHYLDFMYVHKNHLRKGIAEHIYQSLERKAKAMGHSALTSDVSKTARPFFERMGFSVLHENRRLIQGVEIINFHMMKKLQVLDNI